MAVSTQSTSSPPIEVSFCVVNTDKRELLANGLQAIARERASLPFACETIVLDNASTDGSAELARAHPAVERVVALPRRAGKAHCDSLLLRSARGRFALLLNEDSELLPGATQALWEALRADPKAGAAGAQLLRPDRRPQPCAWRFPTPLTSLAAAIGLARPLVVQSKGARTRKVDWCQSSALLVCRRAAAAVGYLDEQFFVYSDEVDFQKRLRGAGYHSLYVPAARAIHHEQLATATDFMPRIVELARNRDRYMRKHHSRLAALLVRLASALGYLLRAGAAALLPGRSPDRALAHARASLMPARGSGLRERAEDHNRALERAGAAPAPGRSPGR
jgi:N-acetylglucosaminyl-diphospho-decaprenol L-rhamnosyltransferase